MADYHITSIEDTLQNFHDDAEHGQRAVLSDTDEMWAWKNDDDSKTIIGAAQGWTVDGSTFAGYYDLDFGEVTLHDDLLVDEYIKLSSVTDNLIRFEDNKISIQAGGNIVAQFEDDAILFSKDVSIEGDLSVGVDAHETIKVNGTTKDIQFGVHGDDTANQYCSYVDRASDTHTPNVIIARARGSHASPTQVADGDNLGIIDFLGWDGTDEDMCIGAQIIARVDGTAGNNDLPTELVFATTADGAAIPTEHMVINQAGNFGFGKTTLEAWDSNYVGFQIGGNHSFMCNITEGVSTAFHMLNNGYYDGEWKRITNDEFSSYIQSHGYHSWYGNEADTEDVAFTPTLQMRLTSADLSTASVQLGIGTATPLLNVGSAAGDFTGDGVHIKSDVANERDAFLIIEGYTEQSLVFANTNGGSNNKLMRIQTNNAQQMNLASMDDDASLDLTLLRVEPSIVTVNPDGADIDFMANTDDNGIGLKVDAAANSGAGAVYAGLDTRTDDTGCLPVYWDTSTEELVAMNLS